MQDIYKWENTADSELDGRRREGEPHSPFPHGGAAAADQLGVGVCLQLWRQYRLRYHESHNLIKLIYFQIYIPIH